MAAVEKKAPPEVRQNGAIVAECRAVAALVANAAPQRLKIELGSQGVTLDLRVLDAETVKACFTTLVSTLVMQQESIDRLQVAVDRAAAAAAATAAAAGNKDKPEGKEDDGRTAAATEERLAKVEAALGNLAHHIEGGEHEHSASGVPATARRRRGFAEAVEAARRRAAMDAEDEAVKRRHAALDAEVAALRREREALEAERHDAFDRESAMVADREADLKRRIDEAERTRAAAPAPSITSPDANDDGDLREARASLVETRSHRDRLVEKRRACLARAETWRLQTANDDEAAAMAPAAHVVAVVVGMKGGKADEDKKKGGVDGAAAVGKKGKEALDVAAPPTTTHKKTAPTMPPERALEARQLWRRCIIRAAMMRQDRRGDRGGGGLGVLESRAVRGTAIHDRLRRIEAALFAQHSEVATLLESTEKRGRVRDEALRTLAVRVDALEEEKEEEEEEKKKKDHRATPTSKEGQAERRVQAQKMGRLEESVEGVAERGRGFGALMASRRCKAALAAAKVAKVAASLEAVTADVDEAAARMERAGDVRARMNADVGLRRSRAAVARHAAALDAATAALDAAADDDDRFAAVAGDGDGDGGGHVDDAAATSAPFFQEVAAGAREAQLAAVRALDRVDEAVQKAWGDVLRRWSAGDRPEKKKNGASQEEPTAESGAAMEAVLDLEGLVRKVQGEVRTKVGDEDFDALRSRVDVASRAAETAASKMAGRLAELDARTIQVDAKVDSHSAKLRALDDLDAKIHDEVKRLLDLLRPAFGTKAVPAAETAAAEERAPRDDQGGTEVPSLRANLESLAKQVRVAAVRLAEVAATKCDRAAMEAAVDVKADRGALEALATTSAAALAEVGEVLRRLREEQEGLTHRDLQSLRRLVDQLALDVANDRRRPLGWSASGDTASATQQRCLTCARDVPETSTTLDAAHRHRELFPRLNSPPEHQSRPRPVSGGGTVPAAGSSLSRAFLDYATTAAGTTTLWAPPAGGGDTVYRAGFKMPLPMPQTSKALGACYSTTPVSAKPRRPGTAPSSRRAPGAPPELTATSYFSRTASATALDDNAANINKDDDDDPLFQNGRAGLEGASLRTVKSSLHLPSTSKLAQALLSEVDRAAARP